MNMTKLTAHIYETRTGELRMIVTDDKGNQAIAPVVPTESLLTLIRNDKDARKARNLYFVDVTTRQGNNIVATRYELNTSVMGAAAKQAFGVND